MIDKRSFVIAYFATILVDMQDKEITKQTLQDVLRSFGYVEMTKDECRELGILVRDIGLKAGEILKEFTKI